MKLIAVLGAVGLLVIVWQSNSYQAAPTAEAVDIGIYDPDPHHIWNRLFEQLYTRTTPNGMVYGPDLLDPLLWLETRYLLEGESYTQTLALLDEFLATNAATLIDDPLKKAFFQRDLWAVADWLTLSKVSYPTERGELQTRLAQIMQQVALTDAEIETLPNNYLAATASYPSAFQPDQPYLPPDLFDPTGPWVSIGREGGPVAITHVSSPYFNGRSAFLVFMQVTGGRHATLDTLQTLRDLVHISQAPALPAGSQVALVRQLFVINKEGVITPTSITLSVQLRHFGQGQDFFQFDVQRRLLFAGQTGGLHPLLPDDQEFMVFGAHGIDYFELYPDTAEEHRAVTLDLCKACHFLEVKNILSVISFSRTPFGLPNGEPARLIETTPADEIELTIAWKTQ